MIKHHVIILSVLVCTIIPTPVKAQIEKHISIQSTPVGAFVYDKGNRNRVLGKTPLEYNFRFHSEKSLKRLTLEACGYYDTTIVIDPGITSINIKLEKRPFLLAVDTTESLLTDSDIDRVRVLSSDLFESLIMEMQGFPVSIMDYAGGRKTGDTISINIAFNTRPENIGIRTSENMDTVLAFVWDNWFRDKIREETFSGSDQKKKIKVYLSMISGNEKLALRHIPGVAVRDDKITNIYRVETPSYIITTTETYYHTESDALFNYSLEKNSSYYEFIYAIDPNDLTSYKDYGLLYIRDGKLNKSYGNSFKDGFLFRRIIKE